MADDWLPGVCGIAVAPPPDPSAGFDLLERLQAETRDAASNEDAIRVFVEKLRDPPAMNSVIAAWRDDRNAVTSILALIGTRRGLKGHADRLIGDLKARTREIEASEKRSGRQRTWPRPAESGRAEVEVVTNRETVSTFFDAIIDKVLPLGVFYAVDYEIAFVQAGKGLVPVTERNLPGLLSGCLEIRYVKETDEGLTLLRYDVLETEQARAFSADPRVRSRFPPLGLYCRTPVFDEAFRFIGTTGYHAEAHVYYDGPVVEARDGIGTLHRALDGFHWKAPADLVNFVGALLTVLTMPSWGRGHPFLAINGNKPGVGKTTLAMLLGVIVEGSIPSTCSFVPDESEFEKQLATRVDAGDHVIVIDNAKNRGAIDSPVLERCITDARINFRRLGSNTAIARERNDILFVLTMNLTTLGQDLRRRALPINLDLDADVQTTTYPLDDVVGYALEHRLEIVGELVGMVQRWIDAGRPACESPARHSTGQRWASTMDAILRLSGFNGFLTNFEESAHAFDAKYDLMLEIAREHRHHSAAPAGEWADLLMSGIMEDRFKDRQGNLRSARSRATTVGNLFAEYVDTRFEVDGRCFRLTRDYVDGDKKRPIYGFVEVGR